MHDREPFLLSYHALVIAVGAVSATFNVPGVREHTLFLKEVADARAIRQRIAACSTSSWWAAAPPAWSSPPS